MGAARERDHRGASAFQEGEPEQIDQMTARVQHRETPADERLCLPVGWIADHEVVDAGETRSQEVILAPDVIDAIARDVPQLDPVETAVRVSLPSFPSPDPVSGTRIEDPLRSELGGKQIKRGFDEPLGSRIEVMLSARRQRLVRLDNHTDRLPAPDSMESE
jgi:hypothetical protein